MIVALVASPEGLCSHGCLADADANTSIRGNGSCRWRVGGKEAAAGVEFGLPLEKGTVVGNGVGNAVLSRVGKARREYVHKGVLGTTEHPDQKR